MKYLTKPFDIQAIGITIASGKEIRNWAERYLQNGKVVGEVTTADTVRLKNLKPIKDGLFCERIFGPVKDFVCSCGKYHKTIRDLKKDQVHQSYYCPECQVAITIAKERRYRLGFIRLHSLVTHVWFFKDNAYNPLPEWLELDKKLVELISYCGVEFLEYDYPQTIQTQKWNSKPFVRNHHLGTLNIKFSHYFFIQSNWLNFFQKKLTFFWFLKRYSHIQKKIFSKIHWKIHLVQTDPFLKIENKAVSSSKCSLLAYKKSNSTSLHGEDDKIGFSSKFKQIFFQENSPLTNQNIFLLKKKKISIFPVLISFELPFLLLFLFHFFQKIDLYYQQSSFLVDEKTNQFLGNHSYQHLFNWLHSFKITKHFSSSKKNFLSTYFFEKKIIIFNCFRETKNLQKNFFSSKFNHYFLKNYTNFLLFKTTNKNICLWNKTCIYFFLGKQKGFWLLKTQKKKFVYTLFLPQIIFFLKKKIISKKKNFSKKQVSSNQTNQQKFFFFSLTKKNLFLEKKILFKTRTKKKNFISQLQLNEKLVRFVISSEQIKQDQKKNTFFIFKTLHHRVNLKKSSKYTLFYPLIKSTFFFHLLTCYFGKGLHLTNVKKLWWWFFLNIKKKHPFQRQSWKLSFLQLQWFTTCFFYNEILDSKTKEVGLFLHFLNFRSNFFLSQVVLTSTTPKKKDFKNFGVQKKTLSHLQTRLDKKKRQIVFHTSLDDQYLKNQGKNYSFIPEKFLIKRHNVKKSKKKSFNLFSIFLFQENFETTFRWKSQTETRLTSNLYNNFKKDFFLEKVIKNKNLKLNLIFYYNYLIKNQIFQLTFNLFSIFSNFFFFFGFDRKKFFFSNQIKNLLPLPYSYFSLKKKNLKIQSTQKKLQKKQKYRKKQFLLKQGQYKLKSFKKSFSEYRKPFLSTPKKRLEKKFEFKIIWILNKKKLFYNQKVSFYSKIFLDLLAKKKKFKEGSIEKKQIYKKNNSFSFFLVYNGIYDIEKFLNRKKRSNFKSTKPHFLFFNLDKNPNTSDKILAPQNTLFTTNLCNSLTYLPSFGSLKLLNETFLYTEPELGANKKTNLSKNYKVLFLTKKLMKNFKRESVFFSNLKKKLYQVGGTRLNFSSSSFFFYLNVASIPVIEIYDEVFFLPFKVKKKNSFKRKTYINYPQKKGCETIKNQSYKKIHNRFSFFCGVTRRNLFFSVETGKSSLFLLFFIERFLKTPDPTFLTTYLTTYDSGLTKTGPQAIFQLLSRYAPFKGHVSSNVFIDFNSSRKKLLTLSLLLKKAPFSFRKYRLKSKQTLSRYRRGIRMLKVLEDFPNSIEKKGGPHILSQMFLSVLPVLPPTLRPIIPLPGNVTAISDLNRLYQRILYRNTRFLKTPEPHYAHRILQEAVDALLENGRGGSKPVADQKNRPYKSLSDILKGKQGRFRQNLLGKRVDYSGRSVIVVGPQLKIHECGLPKQMAVELFQPFLIRALKNFRIVTNIFEAKKIIEKEDPIVWKILHQILPTHPILLNRAPTLHRLGIQAFQPKLVSGQTILLHPLVCTAFNADFDGDQMAVHIPLSMEARSEAWNLMWSRRHLFSAATGQPIIMPTQDMVLGIYYLTTKPFHSLFGIGMFFNTFTEVLEAYNDEIVHLQASIWVKLDIPIETGLGSEHPLDVRIDSSGNLIERFSNVQSHYKEKGIVFQSYICTTPGRILMNQLITLHY